MATREFRLPDPGEGLVEAEIVTWRVAVGDQVQINDIVVEIETSKSLVELPSPYAGTVTALLADEGQMVDVGNPIIAISDGADEPAEAAPADDLTPAAAESEDRALAANAGRVANLVGYGPRTPDTKRRPRRAAEEPAPEPAPIAEAEPEPEPVRRPAAAVLAKPPVRKLAKDLGIDLAGVDGSGPGGIVTREDVLAVAADADLSADPVEAPGVAVRQAQGTTPQGSSGGERETRTPIKGVRKATAEAMVRSAFTAPHVTEWVTCDVTATIELVERLRARREFRDVKISPLLVIAKAVCVALGRVPSLNAQWDEAAQEIVTLHYVNLGVAAATPRGLVVPNLKGADAMTLLELAQALNGAVATAREGRTSPADMAGGTFTITNVGTFGVDAGTPILNPGESGILCVGQIARRPWVIGTGRDERIEPRWVTTLSVSFDHRLVDGEQGSVFLSTVAQILTDPGLGLLF